MNKKLNIDNNRYSQYSQLNTIKSPGNNDLYNKNDGKINSK